MLQEIISIFFSCRKCLQHHYEIIYESGIDFKSSFITAWNEMTMSHPPLLLARAKQQL